MGIFENTNGAASGGFGADLYSLARVFPDRRDPTRVLHSLVDMFRSRMFAIGLRL
jgi:hypothetical protein